MTKIKSAQIILHHEYHSFESEHRGTGWRISIQSSVLFILLFLLGFLSDS